MHIASCDLVMSSLEELEVSRVVEKAMDGSV